MFESCSSSISPQPYYSLSSSTIGSRVRKGLYDSAGTGFNLNPEWIFTLPGQDIITFLAL
nr:MAG TPA: hypothetical protein [Bacteriophage sp.]